MGTVTGCCARANGEKVLVNVASVGSRPQHDGLSAYTVIEWSGGVCSIRQHVVAFDAAEEAHLCAAARLPEYADFRPPAGEAQERVTGTPGDRAGAD